MIVLRNTGNVVVIIIRVMLSLVFYSSVGII